MVKIQNQPKAACYVRVSTNAQVDRFSLPVQKRLLTEFCKQQGWQPEIYEDAGKSGETIDARPAMLRLLKDAREKKIQAAIAVEMERFSRSTDMLDLLVMKRTFRDAGVRWGTPNQMFAPNDPEDEFVSDLFGALSKREKLKIVQRTKRGKIEAARQGRFIATTAPFGYRKDPQSPSRLAVDANEARVVRQVYGMLVDQRLSIRSIAQRLKERGVPTRTGASWSRSMVAKILTTSTYTGKAIYNRQRRAMDGRREIRHRRPQSEWITIPVPLIISAETFRMARAQLRENFGIRNPRAAKRIYLLTGLVRCGRCGGKMYGHFRDRTYYRCDSERGPDSPVRCSMKSIPGELLEEAVWEDLVGFLQGPLHLRTLMKSMQNESALAYKEARDRLSDVKKALDRLAQERNKAQIMYLEGIGTPDEAKAHIERLGRKQETLESERQDLEGILQAKEVDALKAQTLEALLKEARQKLWRSTTREKLELIRAFIEGIEVSEDGKRATVRGILPILDGEKVQEDRTFAIIPKQVVRNVSVRKYYEPPTVDGRRVRASIRGTRLIMRPAESDKVKSVGIPKSNMSMPSRSRSTTAGADQTDRAPRDCAPAS